MNEGLSSASAAEVRGNGAGAQDERAILGRLVDAHKISEEDRRRLETLTATSGRTFGELADRLGILSEAEWAAAVAAYSGLPFLRGEDFPADLPLHDGLRPDFCAARSVLPLAREGETWRFAIANPFDAFTLRALSLATGGQVDYAVATPRDIAGALARLAAATRAPRAQSAAAVVDAATLLELANDAPTVKLVDRILATAIERGATDIHLEAFERGTRLRYRLDGVLADEHPVPLDLYPGVVSRLKILAGLDIAERRMPQDGRFRHRSHGRAIDFRMATAPALHGETIALRLLNPDGGIRTLDDLLMPDHVRGAFERALGERHGLILVTGPTGSGKTTTLHAALGRLNDGQRKILTVENPVEIEVPGVVQVAANPEIGLGFAHTLRSFLRHDPDVIMVGEIRDRETAEVAIQAALTGHLVLSTLHTNDAAGVVPRLVEMGVDRYLIDAVLRFAAAQRLVRVLCTCRRPSVKGEPGFRLVGSVDPSARPCEPVGCGLCSGSGYKGRRGVYEGVSGDALRRDGPQAPYPRMADHVVRLVRDGITSATEAFRVVDFSPLATTQNSRPA